MTKLTRISFSLWDLSRNLWWRKKCSFYSLDFLEVEFDLVSEMVGRWRRAWPRNSGVGHKLYNQESVGWSPIRVCEQKKFSVYVRLVGYELKVGLNENYAKMDSSLFVEKLSWCLNDDDSGVKFSLSNLSEGTSAKMRGIRQLQQNFILWVASVQDAVYSSTG